MSANSQDHSEIIRSATEQDFDRVMEIDRLSFSDPWIYNYFKSSLRDIFLVLEADPLSFLDDTDNLKADGVGADINGCKFHFAWFGTEHKYRMALFTSQVLRPRRPVGRKIY